MASASTSAARKRLNRVIEHHGDELLSLSPRQRDRVMDAAWRGGKPTAKELIDEYRRSRSQANARAAATRLMNRRHNAADKVIQTMGSRVRNHRAMRLDAPMLNIEQVREIEKKNGAALADFVERQARSKPSRGLRNPLWYR